MKTTTIITSILFQILIGMMCQLASAQSACPGNKVRMVKGSYHCGCNCKKKCVPLSEVQTYQNSGWYVGNECFGSCCWIRQDEESSLTETSFTSETSFTGIYPNPVSGSATIFFSLSQAQNVSFKLFDVAGRFVTTLSDEIFEAGENEFIWISENVDPGIYFLQFQSQDHSQTIKLIVNK